MFLGNIERISGMKYENYSLREKCPNTVWSVISGIRTEYGEVRSISPNVGKYGPEKTPY